MCACVCTCVCVHVHACLRLHAMEYYSAIKRDEILPLSTTWTDLEDIMLNKISQMEKDKHHKISLVCEIFSNMNKPNQTEVYIQRTK